jgi:uncharacterized phage-associated protein
MSSAKSVAKELVRLSLTGALPDPLSAYRVQGLIYYAQAWSLVLRDSELFPDDIQAAQEGPVVAALLAAEEGPAWQPLGPESFAEAPGLDDEDEALFLRHLWAAYGYLSPSGLYASMQGEPPFLAAKRERQMRGTGVTAMNELRESFSQRADMPAALATYRRLRHEREKEAERAILNSPPLDVEAIWKGCRSVTPSAGKR